MTNLSRLQYKMLNVLEIENNTTNDFSWEKIDVFMKESFGDEYRGFNYLRKRAIERGSFFFFSMTQNAKIIGLVIIRPSGKKDGTIIHPEFQNRGVGKKLIKYSLKKFPNQCSIIKSSNLLMIKLLISTGFKYVTNINEIKPYISISQFKDIFNIRELENKVIFDRVNSILKKNEKELVALVHMENTDKNFRLVYLPGKHGSIKNGKALLLKNIANDLNIPFTVLDYARILKLKDKTIYVNDTLKMFNEKLIICGSSLGGYITLKIINNLKTITSVILFAPAIGIKEYESNFNIPKDVNIKIIHGYKDKIVPYKNIVNFGTLKKIEIHLVNDSHRLIKSYNLIKQIVLLTYNNRDGIK